MHDDRISGFFRRLRAGQRTHLQTLFRVRQRVLVSDFGQTQALHADAQTCGVHHHEHGVQALVRLADQPALRVIQIDHAGGVAVNAHLVFDGAALHAVTLTGFARCVRHELRHDKERNALGALGRVRQTREHQVNDVIREVVFAARDENLRTTDGVRAVAIRLGLGAQDAEIRAAMRFGQTHRAGPDAGDQLGQIHVLQLRRTVRMQTFIRAVRQTRVHGPGLVRRVEHLVERVVDERGQALATVFWIAAQRWPASFDILLVGFLKALRRGHDAVADVCAAFLIAALIEREQHFGAELAGFFEHGIDRVRIEIRVLRHLPDFGLDVKQLVQHELHVAQWRGVLSHDSLQSLTRSQAVSSGPCGWDHFSAAESVGSGRPANGFRFDTK